MYGIVRRVDGRKILKQPSKAMIHSSRRDRKTKAIAELLAMIATAELPAKQPCPVHETDEWLWEESATEFSAALERYCAGHTPGLVKHRRWPGNPILG